MKDYKISVMTHVVVIILELHKMDVKKILLNEDINEIIWCN